MQQALKGADMVFVTAGKGGGTGTGAAPVIAEIARELGALTVGVVTKPFGFEGASAPIRRTSGIQQLREKVDTLIIIPNDRLLQVVGSARRSSRPSAMADDVLRQGVQGITDLITVPGSSTSTSPTCARSCVRPASALMGIGVGRRREPRG